MLGSTQWSRFLMGAGLAMACGLTVAAAGVEDSATDADGEAAFRRLVATASMRFPDDPTMRALILREADPSWSDSFSELAALELTEGALPLIGLFDPGLTPDEVVYDEVGGRVWTQSFWECRSALVGRDAMLRPVAEVPNRLIRRRGDGHVLRDGGLLRPEEIGGDDAGLPPSWRLSARREREGEPVRAGLIGDGRVAVIPAARDWRTRYATIERVELGESNGLSFVQWSPDGRRLLVVERMGRSNVWIIDVAESRVVFQESMVSVVEDAAFVSEGSRVVVLAEDRTVVVDPSTGDSRLLAESDPPEWAESVAPATCAAIDETPSFPTVPTVSPDGRWRVEAMDENQRLRVVDMTTGQEAGSTILPEMSPLEDDQLDAHWVDQNRLCIVRHWGTTSPCDDWVMLWDVPDPEAAWVQMGIETMGWVDEASQGDLAFIGTMYPDECRLWSWKSPSESARVWLAGSGGTSARWSPQGDRFVVYSRYGDDVEIRDATWPLRRQRLWDNIPAVLTPMQRMQYLGESPEEARRTWEAQVQRDR